LFEIAERPVVAGQQEMISIVDAAAELCIQIRTATPAGVTAGFIKPHAPTLGGQPDRSSEAGEAGADDMHRAQFCSQTRPCRNTSQSLTGFDTLTRVAGSRHPERSRAESVEW
jgi:hypothetical protein